MARAGRKDRRVEIQRLTTTKNTIGEPIEAWALFKTVSAEVTYPDGSEGGEPFGADQFTSELNAFFRIDYIAGISPRTHRIIYERRTFEILNAPEIGRRESLKIRAVARGV